MPSSLDREIAFAAPDIRQEDIEAVVAVLRSGWITTGTECHQLEQELRAYLGSEHVVSLASCTAALETAVAYLGLRPGSRVGVPTWTFASTALAAVRHGCEPVLLDVDAATLNVSAEAVEQAADSLDALVIVHFGGVPVAREVRDIAAAAGRPVIEDAAHALGASDDRGRVNGGGTVGAAYSLYATKNLTSAEGGLLATDDPDLARFGRSYRQHGMSDDAWARYAPDGKPRYDVTLPGIKANLPDVLAALARAQLRRFDEMQRRRRELIERYRSNLGSHPSVEMVPKASVEGSADHLAVVRFEADVDRDRVLDSLRAANIGSSIHFAPLHQMTWFRANADLNQPLDVAESMARRVLSLPLHTRLDVEDVDLVCAVVREALDR